MAGEELAVYLRLTPEFGGTRFGPFEGLEVRLGSNADRCHIVLNEALGVIGEHVRLIRQGSANLILAPADRTATIFLWKQGERRPTQLTTSTAVRPGDGFSLVTPDGPRFIVELDVLPPAVIEQRKAVKGSGQGRNRLTADKMGQEVKRQAWTRLLVLGPAQIAQRAVTFVRSGAIYQPRNIILGMTLLGGWLFAGVFSCQGCSSRKLLSSQSTRLQECESGRKNLDAALSKDSTELDFSELAAQVTNSGTLLAVLKEDEELRNLVRKKVKVILSAEKEYEWLLNGRDQRQRTFTEWRDRVQKEETFDGDMQVLLTWLPVRRDLQSTDFEAFTDSDGVDVCGRGPLRMTYRQAIHLGMTAVPDAQHRGPASTLEAPEEREKLLWTPADLAGRARPEGQVESNFESLSNGKIQCVYLEGSDDRKEMNKSFAMVRDQLGKSADYVPEAGRGRAAVARVAKFWAADLGTVDYLDKDAAFDLSGEGAISIQLDKFEARGDWVLDKTADTLAQSIAVPCLALLNGNPEKMKGVFGDPPQLPDAVSCLYLNWKLSHEK